jgi:CRP-like cAMP-binding protein
MSAERAPANPSLLQMRAQLASVAMPVRLVAGHNLFEEGDAADSFYVLQEGKKGGCRPTA